MLLEGAALQEIGFSFLDQDLNMDEGSSEFYGENRRG